MKVMEIYGRDVINATERQRQRLVYTASQYWRAEGFPYLEFSTSKLQSEYLKYLDSLNRFKAARKVIPHSSIGLSIVNSFHPHMWHVPSQGHRQSPIDHFHDDPTLEKLLLRSANFWPERRCWSPYSIRNMFGMYSGGRVSNFRPTAAWLIAKDFSKPGDSVLDFCAGFGGRLLGLLPLDRHYVGIDPSQRQINGLKKMYETLRAERKCSAEFIKGCAEEVLIRFRSNQFDLVFTSPPYFCLEQYATDRTQSYLRYRTFDEWKEKFLEKVIAESTRVLKPGGIVVINIANVQGYSIADSFREIAAKYLKHIQTLKLEMTSRPAQRVSGRLYRHEPVFVYRKT